MVNAKFSGLAHFGFAKFSEKAIFRSMLDFLDLHPLIQLNSQKHTLVMLNSLEKHPLIQPNSLKHTLRKLNSLEKQSLIQLNSSKKQTLV